MHILPVTNRTTLTKPAFQAKVPKQLVKQMLGKTEPLVNLNVKTAAGMIFTVPAAVAAKLYGAESEKETVDVREVVKTAKPTELPTLEELDNASPLAVVDAAMMQDEDGKTIFHRKFNDNHLNKFQGAASAADLKHVFTLKDNDGKTAYQANPDLRLEAAIFDTAAQGGLSAKDAVELLEENDVSPDLQDFLNARIDKYEDKVNSFVPVQILDEIERIEKSNDITINVPLQYTTYPNISMEAAATIFKWDPVEEELQLDMDYLEKSDDGIYALLNSAYSSEEKDCLNDICRTFDEHEKSRYFFTKIVENTEPDMPKQKDLEILASFLPNDNFRSLFEIKDNEDGWGIVHCIANDDSGMSDLINLLKKEFKPEQVKSILSMKTDLGSIPMRLSDDAMLSIMEQYKNDPKFIAEQLSTQDKDDNTPLHSLDNSVVMKKAFDILQNEPEKLASILMMTDDDNNTIYESLVDDTTLQLVKDKIIELATDSELPVEDSINLLEENILEPQIVEYLKLSQANTDKS